MKQFYLHFGLLALVALAVVLALHVSAAGRPSGKSYSVAERLQQYGERARNRLKPHFDHAAVSYPPNRVTLVGLKEERVLQVYAADVTNKQRFIVSYPVRAAIGNLGPKLREGDLQVAEGIYAIELLNPNSRFHLSLRVGYPNAFDREQARKEGRTNLGGDIMIHGNSVSIGCLAMGDEVAEDLFVLAADTGLKNMAVILAPVDFRAGKTLPNDLKLPPWTRPLYQEIKARLAELPAPKVK